MENNPVDTNDKEKSSVDSISEQIVETSDGILTVQKSFKRQNPDNTWASKSNYLFYKRQKITGGQHTARAIVGMTKEMNASKRQRQDLAEQKFDMERAPVNKVISWLMQDYKQDKEEDNIIIAGALELFEQKIKILIYVSLTKTDTRDQWLQKNLNIEEESQNKIMST